VRVNVSGNEILAHTALTSDEDFAFGFRNPCRDSKQRDHLLVRDDKSVRIRPIRGKAQKFA
jgi:hypothetical protein